MQVVTAYQSDDGKVYSTEDLAKKADFNYWLGRLQYARDHGVLNIGDQAGILMFSSNPLHNQLKNAIQHLADMVK